MNKEKNQSNKKNTEKKKNHTTKTTAEQVTDTKIAKATKTKNKERKTNVKVYDTMEEATKDFEESLNNEDILEEDENNVNLEEETITKTSKDKKKNHTEEKIKNIEKLAKEKKVKTSRNNNTSEFLLFLDKNRYAIYAFIGGVLLTTLVAMIIWPDRIATLKNGEQPVVKVGKVTYTADELYENMKDYYSVNLLLDQIDTDLLTKLYPEDDELKEEVNSNAEYYLNLYNQYYGYTEEQFLEANGFKNYNEFLKYLTLDYRRNKYLEDHVKENLSDDEIQKYYDENVFGDINTQHVLVEVSTNSEEEDGMTDEDAKKIAEEIITKLNDGTSWKKIQEEYKEKITYEDLSYQSWDASLEESFMNALINMEDNTYSEEPVKTSYGYHVIYRIDQKETPSLKDVKETIIKNLVTEKQSEDSNLLYKSLISLREKNKINFKDTVMKEKYDTYCEQYK